MQRPLTPLIAQGDIRLLTLTGPGSVDKTRLAIEAAEQVSGDFAGGTVFVDLAPLRDPGLLLSAIARQLLVLLDSFEHLPAAWDGVLALLETCPRLVMLVTSRWAWMSGAGRSGHRIDLLQQMGG